MLLCSSLSRSSLNSLLCLRRRIEQSGSDRQAARAAFKPDLSADCRSQGTVRNTLFYTSYCQICLSVCCLSVPPLLKLREMTHPSEEAGAGPAESQQGGVLTLSAGGGGGGGGGGVTSFQLPQPPLVTRHSRPQLLSPLEVCLVVEEGQEVIQRLFVQLSSSLPILGSVRRDGLQVNKH